MYSIFSGTQRQTISIGGDCNVPITANANIRFRLRIQPVVAVVKIDGERIMAGASAIYTVVLSGGALGTTEFCRCDGSDLISLMEGASEFYRAAKDR